MIDLKLQRVAEISETDSGERGDPEVNDVDDGTVVGVVHCVVPDTDAKVEEEEKIYRHKGEQFFTPALHPWEAVTDRPVEACVDSGENRTAHAFNNDIMRMIPMMEKQQ